MERSVRVGRRRAQCCRNQDAGEELCGRVFVKETRGVRKDERPQEKTFFMQASLFCRPTGAQGGNAGVSAGGCAAKEDAGGLHGRVEEGAATSRSSLRTKRIFLRRRKNIPSGQGSGRDVFAEGRAESARWTGAARRRRTGVSAATLLRAGRLGCVCAWPSGEAWRPASGKAGRGVLFSSCAWRWRLRLQTLRRRSLRPGSARRSAKPSPCRPQGRFWDIRP